MDPQQQIQLLKDTFKSDNKFLHFIKGLLLQHKPSYIDIYKDNDFLNGVVVYREETIEGEQLYTACIAKAGDISGGTKVKETNKPDNLIKCIKKILNKDFYIENNLSIKTDRIIIASSGYISKNTIENIKNKFKEAVLYFWDVEKINQITEKKWPGFFESKRPIISEYCKKLQEKLEDISKELYILYYNKKAKSLWDLFVDLQLEETVVKNVNTTIPTKLTQLSNKITGNKAGFEIINLKKIKRNKYKIQDILEKGEDVIIMGDFGSGKTTILKRITQELINQSKLQDFYKFPIYLNARDFCNHNFNLVNIIENEISKHTDGKSIDIESNLQEGKVVLVVDGLEEKIEDYDYEILKCLNAFKTTYANVQLIVSTRPIVVIDKEPLFDNFRRFEILPLDYTQVSELLEKWYPTNPTHKNKLLNALKKTALGSAIPKTPLAITLLAIIFEDENKIDEIPANITELYNKFTDVFSGRWDKEKGITNQDKFGIRTHLTSQLSFMLHFNNKVEILENELIEFIEDYRRLKGFLDTTKEELLSELLDRNPLIYKNGIKYKFVHLSFQEYYASFGILQTNPFVDDAEKFLTENFLNPWWSSVILFYVGQKKDCPEFIKNVSYNSIPENIDQRYLKIDNLSKLIQAAISTDVAPKVIALNSSLKTLDQFRNDLTNLISTDPNFNLMSRKNDITNLSIILIIRNLFNFLYKSKYSKPIMIEIIENGDLIKRSHLSFYILSYTLSEMTNDPQFMLDFINNDNVNLEWRYLGMNDVKNKIPSLDDKQKKIIRSVDRKIKRGAIYLISKMKELSAIPSFRKSVKKLNK